MKYVLLLLLPLLFVTCGKDKDVSPDNPIVGRWSLVEQRDSTGKWQTLLFPLETNPPTIEFRNDGTITHFGTGWPNPNPQNSCCQPTNYVFDRPKPCPPNAQCLRLLGTIRFTSYVRCATVNCTGPTYIQVFDVNDTFLDVYSAPSDYPVTAFRYRRVE